MEQRQQRDTVLGDLAADGPADAGGRQQSTRWQEKEQLSGMCARSSPQQARTSSRIPVPAQLLPTLGATTIRSAKRCRRGERGGFTPHLYLLLYLQSILGGKLSSACHPACHGDAEWPLSPARGLLSLCWKGGEQQAPILCEMLQQPSWANDTFAPRHCTSQCHSRPLRCAQREEDPQQPYRMAGCPGGAGANKGVLGGAELWQPFWSWQWKSVHWEFILVSSLSFSF